MKVKYVKPTIVISLDNCELLQAVASNITGDKKKKILRPSDEKESSVNSKNK